MAPVTVVMSVHTGTPALTPIETSPEAPLTVSRPRWTQVDRDVAAAGAERRVVVRVAEFRSPLPVLTTVVPRAVSTVTSPEPVETELRAAGLADLDVAGAALDLEVAAHVVDPDVAGAGLDEQVALDGVDG